MAREDWPTVKPSTPLGQVPVLEFTSKDGSSKASLCQTAAIVRTLATMYGISGKNLQEIARSDEAFERFKVY